MIIYYIPRGRVLSPELLRESGLAGVIDRAVTRETICGPDGASGLLVTNVGNLPGPPTHDLITQHWQKRFGGSGNVWIGNLKPPAKAPPATFARDQQIAGTPCTLADGQSYNIPLLRSFDPEQLEGALSYQCQLDQTLTQDPETGQMRPGDVVEKYAKIWDTAIDIGDQLLAQITGGKPTELSDQVLFDFAFDCLSLNYRLEKPELSALRLVTIQQAVRIMQLAIDWDTLRANLKNRLRRRSDGTTTASGATPPTEASITPTDQPSPN